MGIKLPFGGPRKKKKATPRPLDRAKEDAVRRNKEASDALEKALERLGPMKGMSDLLGGG